MGETTRAASFVKLSIPNNTVAERKFHWFGYAIKLVIAVLLLFGAAGIGLETALWQKHAPLVWPPTGLGLAIILLGGYIYLPAISISFLLIAVFQGNGLPYGVASALIYTISLGGSAWVLQRACRFSNAMERMRDVLAFLLVPTILGTAVSANATSVVLCFLNLDSWSDFAPLLALRWFGDALGMIVLGPFILVWFSLTRINWNNRQAAEVMGWLTALIFVGFMIFSNWAPTDTLRYPLELAMFPILAWAAIRFGQRGVTTGILIISIMAVWELREVIGPDATKFHTQSPPFLCVYVGVLSITGLLLAAILTEHQNREDVVRQNEQRLRAFIDALPDLAFVIDREGRHLEVFAPRDSVLHKRRGEYRGKTFDEIYEPESAEKFHNTVQRTIDTGEIQLIEYSIPVDGKRYWFEGRTAPLDTWHGGDRRVVWMASDITERKRAQDALQYRDRLLQGVANAMGSLLTIKDFDEAIIAALEDFSVSTPFARIFVAENERDAFSGSLMFRVSFQWEAGVGAYTLEGRKVQRQTFDYDREFPGLRRILTSEGVARGVLRDLAEDTCSRFADDGEQSHLMVPVRRDKEFWGIVGICAVGPDRIWDESEVAALTTFAGSIGGFLEGKMGQLELKRAKEAADAASQAKGEFLAMMSHEIRTPMNAILGFADLLAQTEISEDQTEYLKIIHRSGKSLLELIDNILDFSKIESRAIDLEQAPFRLENTVVEALEIVLVKAREKKLALDYQITDATGGIFIGDAHRIRQILLNLVNNAVKFTAAGDVYVAVATTQVGPRHWKIHFAVRDTGIGIESEKIDHLFQPFSQLDSFTTRQYGGTGLALVICKRLCEKMGGNIWVESEQGRGSTFHFTIKVESATRKEQTPEMWTTNKFDYEFGEAYPLRILLVENDTVNQRLALEILSKLGYKAEVASDGRECMDLVIENDYGAIMMDLQMPGVDGLEATRRIRQGECGPLKTGIQIIAVTAYALPRDREKCLDAGMNDYVPKPIRISQLKDTLIGAYNALHRA